MNYIKNLTDPQKQLLNKIMLYKYVKNNTGIFLYEDMKNICEFKSFDSTFNALLNKGILRRIETNDFSNKFKLNF
jgi:hypothetical protein